MIHVRVRNEPIRRTHKRPRLGAEIEAELVFRNSPIRLNGSARKPFDRNILERNASVGLVRNQNTFQELICNNEKNTNFRILPHRGFEAREDENSLQIERINFL